MKNSSKSFARHVRLFKENKGVLKSSQAIRLGIHPRDLYAMKDQGVIESVSRGLYRLSSMEPLSSPDLATVTLKIPQGVICLISALAIHGITTQIPHRVDVALKRSSEKPRLRYPPLRFIWLSEPSFSSGIETHAVDGHSVRVYSPEKTVADCFKYRNKITLEIALEALKLCRARKGSRVQDLMKYAKIDRVERIMGPYVEALL